MNNTFIYCFKDNIGLAQVPFALSCLTWRPKPININNYTEILHLLQKNNIYHNLRIHYGRNLNFFSLSDLMKVIMSFLDEKRDLQFMYYFSSHLSMYASHPSKWDTLFSFTTFFNKSSFCCRHLDLIFFSAFFFFNVSSSTTSSSFNHACQD